MVTSFGMRNVTSVGVNPLIGRRVCSADSPRSPGCQGERVALGEFQHPEGHFAFVVELVGVVHQRDDEVVLARGLLLRFVRIGASGEQRSAGQCSGGKQSV